MKMKMIYFLFVSSLLISTSLASPIHNNVVDEYIKCFDQVAEGDKNSTCVAEGIKKTPWNTNASHIPAPTPDSLDVDWYTTMTSQGKNIIMLNITWSQQRTKVMEFVKGYFVEIKQYSMTGSAGFKRKFNINFNQTSNNDEGDMMWFSYDGCCSRDNPLPDSLADDIVKDTGYSVTLHALPMYHKGDSFKSSSVRGRVQIPDCKSDERIRATDLCDGCCDNKTTSDTTDEILPCPPCPQDLAPYDDGDYTDYNETDVHGDDYSYGAYYGAYPGNYPQDCICPPITPPPANRVISIATSSTAFAIGIAVGGLVIAFVVFLLITLKWKQHTSSDGNKAPLSGENDGIVILVPTLGVEGRPPVWELTQKLASYLHNDDVMVTCNLWHQLTTSAHQWLSDVIAHHRSCGVQSHVVLMQIKNGTSEIINEGGATDAYQIFNEKLKDSHTHSIVHFDDDVIPPTTSSSHHFHLPRDVIKLICELTNASCKDDDVIVSELKQLATKVRMTSHQQV